MIPSPVWSEGECGCPDRVGEGSGRPALLLYGFAGYLRSERGVTELTVDVYVGDRRRFLVDRGEGDLSELTAADVSEAVLGRVTCWSPASVRRCGCSLRGRLLAGCSVPAAARPGRRAGRLATLGRTRPAQPHHGPPGPDPTGCRLGASGLVFTVPGVPEPASGSRLAPGIQIPLVFTRSRPRISSLE
jgi:hypothetical protein